MNVSNFFKKKKEKEPAEVQAVKFQEKEKSIVARIHEDFLTYVERILSAPLTERESEEKQKEQAIIEKAERLAKLGIHSAEEVREAERILEKTEKQKYLKKRAEAARYFSFKYPHYKFITEEGVKELCSKYRLIYGEIGGYKGTVPDENLEHMEKFKIADEDAMYTGSRKISAEAIIWNSFRFGIPLTYEEALQAEKEGAYDVKKAPWEIVAPEKDFILDRSYFINEYHIADTIEDPVVLCPVSYKGDKYYLIVTAWGDEASDVNVVNERMN